MKIIGLVGTRPNFIKMAPVIEELSKHSFIRTILVHTGQHFDKTMSDIFFTDLGLSKPDINLNLGNISTWAQSGKIIELLGDIISDENPDWIIVPGDVNSSLAGAISAIRTNTKLAHLESGLRSFDRSMPEELNRIATDHLSDILLVTEPSGLKNLEQEGIPSSRVKFVGNTMIDTLLKLKAISDKSNIHEILRINVDEPYTLVTMHRPATVDSDVGLYNLVEVLEYASKKGKVIFPLHPRTLGNIKKYSLKKRLKSINNLTVTEPLGYLDFIALISNSRMVLTDSGGIQEETTVLGVTCLTLRTNTERPITCEIGTNRVVGTDPSEVIQYIKQYWHSPISGKIPERWDGSAARRVVDILLNN